MRTLVTSAIAGTREYAQSDNPYLKSYLSWGLISGAVSAVVTGDLLTGFAILVALACAGLLWFRSGVPVFVFCVAYQWLFVVTGYFYWKFAGSYPGMRYLGDLDLAIGYSLLGLVTLSLGIWLTVKNGAYKTQSVASDYDATKIFWVVIGLFSINWIVELSGVGLRLMAFNVAQILHHVLMVRYLFLYLLLLTIVREREHIGLGILAFGYVLLPELTSSMTKFKDLFFLLVIVLMNQWRPNSRRLTDKRTNRAILVIVSSLTVFLLLIGLVWSSGMKQSWRTALLSGEVTGTPIEKIEAYGEHAAESIQNFEAGRGAMALASRLSSGIAYFSHVVRIVPAVVEHENGTLSWHAIRHVLMPRFLFPEKPDLGGDSWLVRKYAHLNVSGDESNTSVGLGYMAEFYIDFGFPGMLVPLFLYGILLGMMYRMLYRMSPSDSFFSAVVAGLFLLHFLSYEGNFAKLLGGVLQNFLILVVLLFLFGQRVDALLKRNDNVSGASSGPPGR